MLLLFLTAAADFGMRLKRLVQVTLLRGKPMIFLYKRIHHRGLCWWRVVGDAMAANMGLLRNICSK
jgi:hypothetical protein